MFYKKADIFYKTFDTIYKSFGIGYKISNTSYKPQKSTVPRTMHKNVLFLDSWRLLCSEISTNQTFPLENK